ncbi:dynein regulatory complex subunit 3-like isoform X2 [Tribolium madens]|uniref:dynein regulatory complex subunit 3-like isoform X2 n=1 Tax=Tribolium madens TaxID=41895 RepID=UPI001CF73524|nr:dynein regulatory complex subunit 3-like isoform X2 [Tribolium madens]
MNPCKLKEPKVIDNALLEKCIKDQGPKGEAGRLAEIEKIPLEDVTEIRLEFLNILRIDHLWVLNSLTKLNLNNNLLEKIENLESLVNLIELNLSFNKIARIENLDELRNLEKLSLYENEITVLENMDTLTKLTVFSIGRNKIDDLDNILYLRRFGNLKSLNLVGNPCAEDEDFRLFIAAFLPQLVYYEYKLIYDSERELGQETFSAKLRALLEKEEQEREITALREQELADAELHASSFVEYLNTRHLFDSLFANDTDGVNLLEIGEDAQEFFDEYEENFMELCKQIFENGQQQYVLRKTEYDQFLKCVEDANKDNQDESIKHMEIFLEKKAIVFLKIKNVQNQLNSNEINYDEFIDKCDAFVVEYDEMLHEVWKALMKLELELYEQMEEVNQTFEHNITELVNNFIESSQAFFTQIRELEVSYAENIGDLATKFQTNANLNEEIEVPTVLKPLMADKDLLHNALATSHDMHMQIIDTREDTLISNAKDWLNDLIENLNTDEIKRNRGKVLEINHFLEIQKQEFEDLNKEYAPDLEDDIIALE